MSIYTDFQTDIVVKTLRGDKIPLSALNTLALCSSLLSKCNFSENGSQPLSTTAPTAKASLIGNIVALTNSDNSKDAWEGLTRLNAKISAKAQSKFIDHMAKSSGGSLSYRRALAAAKCEPMAIAEVMSEDEASGEAILDHSHIQKGLNGESYQDVWQKVKEESLLRIINETKAEDTEVWRKILHYSFTEEVQDQYVKVWKDLSEETGDSLPPGKEYTWDELVDKWNLYLQKQEQPDDAHDDINVLPRPGQSGTVVSGSVAPEGTSEKASQFVETTVQGTGEQGGNRQVDRLMTKLKRHFFP